MMGRTHALGGVAAFAATSLVLTPHEPLVWGFVLASASALVPDADNDRGSLMNRPYLLPLKLATFPLWYGAPHRGRTHSLVGTLFYAAIILGWSLALAALVGRLLPGAGWSQLQVVAAAGVGYLSHIVLDSFNLLGQTMLWPLTRATISAPLPQAHGFIPGRFRAGSRWERWGVWPLLAAFVGWYAVNELGHLIWG